MYVYMCIYTSIVQCIPHWNSSGVRCFSRRCCSPAPPAAPFSKRRVSPLPSPAPRVVQAALLLPDALPRRGRVSLGHGAAEKARARASRWGSGQHAHTDTDTDTNRHRHIDLDVPYPGMYPGMRVCTLRQRACSPYPLGPGYGEMYTHKTLKNNYNGGYA